MNIGKLALAVILAGIVLCPQNSSAIDTSSTIEFDSECTLTSSILNDPYSIRRLWAFICRARRNHDMALCAIDDDVCHDGVSEAYLACMDQFAFVVSEEGAPLSSPGCESSIETMTQDTGFQSFIEGLGFCENIRVNPCPPLNNQCQDNQHAAYNACIAPLEYSFPE